PLDFTFGNGPHEVGEHLVDRLVVFELVLDPHRLGERHVHPLFDLAIEVVADFLLRHFDLLLAAVAGERVDGRHDLADCGVRVLERLHDLLFGDFFRARFDHHDRVLRICDDEIETRLLPLFECRIDDVVAPDEAHANAGDGLREGNGRERKRGRRAGDREHVGIVIRVSREQQRDDLRFVPPAVREERPDWTIDQSAREDFLFAGFAFALEETAGDATGCVGVLAVVDGQREEVDAFPRSGGRACGHQDDGVAGADEDGPVRLFGEAPRLERDGTSANRNVTCVHSESLCELRQLLFGLWALGFGLHGFRGSGRSRGLKPEGDLLPDSEALDQIRIAVGVLTLQVIQQAAPLADELQQPAAGVMILRMRLEMVGEVIYSLTEEGDLDFGGTRVAVVRSIAADNFGLAVLAQHLSSTYGPEPSASRSPHQAAVAPPLVAVFRDESVFYTNTVR